MSRKLEIGGLQLKVSGTTLDLIRKEIIKRKQVYYLDKEKVKIEKFSKYYHYSLSLRGFIEPRKLIRRAIEDLSKHGDIRDFMTFSNGFIPELKRYFESEGDTRNNDWVANGRTEYNVKIQFCIYSKVL